MSLEDNPSPRDGRTPRQEDHYKALAREKRTISLAAGVLVETWWSGCVGISFRSRPDFIRSTVPPSYRHTYKYILQIERCQLREPRIVGDRERLIRRQERQGSSVFDSSLPNPINSAYRHFYTDICSVELLCSSVGPGLDVIWAWRLYWGRVKVYPTLTTISARQYR